METKTEIQCKKLMDLEDYMVMYGFYNAKTLEELVDTLHKIDNTTTPNKRLFTGDLNTAFTLYVNKQAVKYVKMYEECKENIYQYLS